MQTGYAAQSEYSMQVQVFDWSRDPANLKKFPELALMFHVPNGGARDKITGARLKRMGVLPGIPDIFLPIARSGFHGLWIELKAKGKKPRPEQMNVLNGLIAEGYAAIWADSAEMAIEQIGKYLTAGVRPLIPK